MVSLRTSSTGSGQHHPLCTTSLRPKYDSPKSIRNHLYLFIDK